MLFHWRDGVIGSHVEKSSASIRPRNTYSGPPPPSSYSTLAHNSGLLPSYISRPDSYRALKKGKEEQAQQQKQSLPSINEALGNKNAPLYTDHFIARVQAQQTHAPPTPLSSNLAGSAGGEGPSGPADPLSNSSSVSLFQNYGSQQPPLQADILSSSMNTQDSTKPLFNSLVSPTQSAKAGITSISAPQPPSRYDYSAMSPSLHFSLRPQRRHHPTPRPITEPDFTWDLRGNRSAGEESMRAEDYKGGLEGDRAVTKPPYGDSVKEHLDIYDVEASLNMIAEMNTLTLDFSRHYSIWAHQTQQRSGPVLGSLPSLVEVEEMINNQRWTKDALIGIRTATINQEHAMAEQVVQRRALKPGMWADEHMALYQEKFKIRAGFTGAELKKRIGKAEPPRHCHSCNRAETPEWRRGPDGPRTLCNACGLHYAKLTREMGANKVSSLRSNLKPKGALDSVSPRSH